MRKNVKVVSFFEFETEVNVCVKI